MKEYSHRERAGLVGAEPGREPRAKAPERRTAAALRTHGERRPHESVKDVFQLRRAGRLLFRFIEQPHPLLGNRRGA